MSPNNDTDFLILCAQKPYIQYVHMPYMGIVYTLDARGTLSTKARLKRSIKHL